MSKSNIPQNPPAFPNPVGKGIEVEFDGMTLKDYFAAKAIQGFCANIGSPADQELLEKYAVAEAYIIANLMLAEREKDL